MMTSTYEQAGRFAKATKIAAHLHAHGICASETNMILPEQWRALAGVVGVNAPSQETIKAVDEILQKFEAADALRVRESETLGEKRA